MWAQAPDEANSLSPSKAATKLYTSVKFRFNTIKRRESNKQKNQSQKRKYAGQKYSKEKDKGLIF